MFTKIGHRHFWKRAVSRRDVLLGAAAAAEVAAGARLLPPFSGAPALAASGAHLTDRCYVNNLSADDRGSVAQVYGSNYDRLVTIKRRYDPENVFRLNHKIDPSG